MIDTRLSGKVALITGANHGIGAATARTLAAEGVAVFITYLRLPPLGGASETPELLDLTTPGLALYNARRAQTADEVVAAIRAHGGRAEALEANLAELDTITRLFDRAEASFGPVDILVNNADAWQGDTFVPARHQGAASTPAGVGPTTITAASHDRHFAVNSRAVALLMAEFARRSIAGSRGFGRLINVSTDGASGFAHEISYGASKYAMESYTRAAARELGAYGITANVVSLGPIQTGYITPALEHQLMGQIPLRRVGQPEDVADVIVFLASHQARWLTGQVLFVGGGHRME